MKLSSKDQQYTQQQGIATMLYNCEPLGFNELVTLDEMHAMSKYYFVDRDVDVDNIYEYKQRLEKDNPANVQLAKNALRKVASAYRVDDTTIRDLFKE